MPHEYHPLASAFPLSESHWRFVYADRIARFTELRDHLSALPHDQSVRFNEVDDTAEAAAA